MNNNNSDSGLDNCVGDHAHPLEHLSKEEKAGEDPAYVSADQLRSWRSPDVLERPDIWPACARRDGHGVLCFGKLNLVDLLEGTSQVPFNVSTPTFLTDMRDLRLRAQGYRNAFDNAFSALCGAQVHYAAKAFFTTEVARVVSDAGLGLDTASAGELAVALASGVDKELIGLHGNAKSPELLSAAIKAGIGRLIIDSSDEILRLIKVFDNLEKNHPIEQPVGVMLRVTTGVHAGGHEFIATAHEDQKFGLSMATDDHGDSPALLAVRLVLAEPRLKLIGLHSHIGSQIFDMDAFAAAAQKILQLREQINDEFGVLVPELDLGGGYPVAYTDEDPIAPSAQEIAQTLAQQVKDNCDRMGQPYPKVSIEPGRSVIGPTTVTLYRVVNIKKQRIDTIDGTAVYRCYVSVDGGMSDNIRPALYGAKYSAILANRRGSDQLVACRIVGSHCESGDILVSDLALPADIAPGDLLAVAVTGAYGWAMTSAYNLFSRPGVLGVDPENPKDSRWLAKPHSITDMLDVWDPGFHASPVRAQIKSDFSQKL